MFIFLKKGDAHAETYDNAYTFYHQFKGSNLMQAKDGYIYVGNRAGVASSSSTYLYNERGHRLSLLLNGVTYYIDLKRGLYGGIYDQNISDLTVGSYVYNLYRISYQSICQLLQYNYPDVDLAVLYESEQSVQLTYDSIMTIKKLQKNGSYSLFGDLSNDHLGRPPTWGNLYFNESTMEKAWESTTGQAKYFGNFYHLQIIIPGKEKGTFLTTTAIKIKPAAGIYKTKGLYYVKAGKLVEYSFSANSNFASNTFQPNYMYLDVKDVNENSYIATTLFAYAPAGRTDATINNPVLSRIALAKCDFARSDSNCCLDYTGHAKIIPDGERFLITPRCEIYINGVCQVSTAFGDSLLGVTVVSDGKPPVIESKQNGNVLSVFAKEEGSGLDYIKIYTEDGVERLRARTDEVTYPITKNEVYRIVAVDRVGNKTECLVPVTYEELRETKFDFRFLSKVFLDKQEEDGGLKKCSLFRSQPELKKILEEALTGLNTEEIIEWDEP